MEGEAFNTFCLEGVPKEFDAIDLKRALNKLDYGKLLKVRVLNDKGTTGRGLAFVAYERTSCTLRYNSNIRIDTKQVRVKPAKKPEDIDFDFTRLVSLKVSKISIDFGVNFRDRTYKTVPFKELLSHVKPKLMLNLEKKRLYFTFHEGNIRTKVEIPLTSVTSGVQVNSERAHSEINFLCTSVPLFYRYDDQTREKQWAWSLVNESKCFERTVGFWRDRSEPILKFMLRNLSFKVLARHDYVRDFCQGLLNFNLLDERWTNAGYAQVLSPQLNYEQLLGAGLPYSVVYLVLCYLSHCYFNVYTTTPAFLGHLAELAQQDLIGVEYCLEQMFFDCDESKLVSVEDPHAFFEEHYARVNRRLIRRCSRENYVMMRTVLVTPCTYYFLPPNEEVMNRVTRKYTGLSDRFLRMKFVDENLNRVLKYSEELLTRVKKSLNNFEVVGREFSFLAFSSSQLRTQSVLTYSETEISASEIRSWIGDLSAIRNPAKHSARLGQCLAASIKLAELTPEQIISIEDLKTEDSKYTFSDGCGYIHPDFFVTLQPDPCISAVQFRLGGIKGILAVNPQAESRTAIYIRPSMLKFQSPCHDFEMLNYAEFRYGYLNRQFIILMNALGVDAQVFLDIQDTFLEDYRQIFTDSRAARNILQQHNTEDVQSLMLDRVIDMVDRGFTVTEPFLQEVLKAVYNYTIMEIKRKQRVLVKDSVCLMGVMDETGLLQYGQVFAQTAVKGRQQTVERTIIQGRVVVSKNPCMHPGDILVLDAVDIPALRHIVNVVVFPSKGPRPHPNEVSGSDLDGDLYFVSYDQRTLPGGRVKPMEYETTSSVEQMSREVQVADIIDFLADYFEKDNLGQIANAHLALADQSDLGPSDPKCIELCKLHSDAVDFPKTGKAAEFPAELKPKKWPHYMEHKRDYETYISGSVIGRMYDRVKKFSLGSIPAAESDPRLLLSDDYDCQPAAAEIFSFYRTQVAGHMSLYTVDSEAALLTGEVELFSKYFMNKVKRREEVKLKFNLVTLDLMEFTREAFEAAVRDGKDRKLLASACYRLGVQEKFYGFPWVVAANELFELAQEAGDRESRL
jgi:RNA-dependent RNA polymerase